MAIWGGGGFFLFISRRSSGFSYPVWDGTGGDVRVPEDDLRKTSIEIFWLNEDLCSFVISSQQASFGINPYLVVAALRSGRTDFSFRVSKPLRQFSAVMLLSLGSSVSSRAPCFRISKKTVNRELVIIVVQQVEDILSIVRTKFFVWLNVLFLGQTTQELNEVSQRDEWDRLLHPTPGGGQCCSDQGPNYRSLKPQIS